jgi:hypothetical protein
MANDVPEVQIGPRQPLEKLANRRHLYAFVGYAGLSLPRLPDSFLPSIEPGPKANGGARLGKRQ